MKMQMELNEAKKRENEINRQKEEMRQEIAALKA